MTKEQDYNYDRIVTAQAQMNAVQTDMAMCLHRGKVNMETRTRMVRHLRCSADDLERLVVAHEWEGM